MKDCEWGKGMVDSIVYTNIALLEARGYHEARLTERKHPRKNPSFKTNKGDE